MQPTLPCVESLSSVLKVLPHRGDTASLFLAQWCLGMGMDRKASFMACEFSQEKKCREGWTETAAPWQSACPACTGSGFNPQHGAGGAFLSKLLVFREVDLSQ